MRFLYALAFVAALVSAAGCGRTWPSVLGVADPRFLAAGGVRTVAILPLAVDVGVTSENDDGADAVAARFDAAARAYLGDELTRRGYAVVELEEPSGQPPDAVLGLTGAAYAGDDGPRGAEIAGAVVTAIVIIGIIVVLAALARGHGGGGGGGGKGGLGAVGAHGGGGGGGGGGPRWHPRGSAGAAPTGWHDHGGRPVTVRLDLPVPSLEGRDSDGPSSATLDVRLVDARTGEPLWRAQAQLPANPGDDGDVREAVHRLLATLPPAR